MSALRPAALPAPLAAAALHSCRQRAAASAVRARAAPAPLAAQLGARRALRAAPLPARAASARRASSRLSSRAEPVASMTPVVLTAAAVRVARILFIGGAGASSLSAAASRALKGNPTFEALAAAARNPGATLGPAGLLTVQLLALWLAASALLKAVEWAASAAPQLALAEKALEAEADRLEEGLEESLRRAGVHLPPAGGRLIHDHLAHPFRTFIVGTAALLGALCTAAALSSGTAAPPPLLLGVPAAAALLRAWQLLAVACGAWVAVFWEQVVFSRLARSSPADAGTLGVLSTLSQRATLVCTGLLTLHVLGVPLAALVTFGGVGGLAIGLASQVAASNLVAGASLLVAAPFRVGDKVDLPGRNMVGFVHRFALDNTQIVLEDTSVVTVPNAELAKSAIRNLSRMAHWRVQATFRVPFSRARDVRALAQRMEAYCRGRADFAEAPPRVVARVVVGDIGDYSLPINVTTWMLAPGVPLPEFERRKSEILLDLEAIIRDAGVPLQLPASAVALTRAEPGAGEAGAGADAGGAAVPLRS